MARDYQLVAKFYRENPIVQIGGNNKISPTKISNQVKAAMKGEGPRQELMDSLRPLTQFYTAQEFGQGRVFTVLISLSFRISVVSVVTKLMSRNVV